MMRQPDVRCAKGAADPDRFAAADACAAPSFPCAQGIGSVGFTEGAGSCGSGLPCFAEPACSPAWAVRITHFTVKSDRIVAAVEVAHERFAVSTPEFIAAVQKRYPTILQHTCVNDLGPTFAAVACETSVPHVLEHMVVDAQARAVAAAGGAPATFVGKTSWENRARRRARVEVSFADDLVALKAFRDAVTCLNSIMLK